MVAVSKEGEEQRGSDGSSDEADGAQGVHAR